MNDLLRDKLAEQVVIFDGAIGTEIYRHNFFINTSFEGLCLSSPQAIGEIHRQYAEAGADVLTTNTFNANFNKLSRFGLGDKVREINIAAVRLARENSNGQLIAGSVGPIGELDPAGGISEEGIVEMLSDQLRALAEGGADFIIFESLASSRDTTYAVQAATVTGVPYVLSFSLDRNGESATGESLDALMTPVNAIGGDALKPTALGINCGEGPESTLSALEIFIRKVGYPVIVQPNAGVPKKVDSRMIYMTSPEYFTTYCLRYVNIGARGVGGCCGVGPAHIADMSRSVRPLSKSEHKPAFTVNITPEETLDPIPTAEKSALGRKLANGEWIATIEITPPRGFDLASTIEKAILCREAGIDAINIPDGPRASSRISPLVTAIEIQEKAGIETILHFCCRDKNLIGMQAEILGCACKKINNVLFITGDPPKLGDYPFSSGVFDVDSIGMVRIQDRLNRGLDIGGKPLGAQTAVLCGVGADPNAIDEEREYRRICEKAEAGAEFIITQPVFACEPLLKFIRRIAHLRLPLIAGIWPLASYRNAEFMKNEVPGVVVPDDIMERMARAKTREEQREEGIMIARESVGAIRSEIQGIQVSAPFGNVNTAIRVIKG